MPGTLAWERPSLGDSWQSRKIAALLHSLYFVFTMSLLPKCSVKYYDYIVTWCSGIMYRRIAYCLKFSFKNNVATHSVRVGVFSLS